MKKFLLVIAILFSLQSFAQVDSAGKKVSVSLQARDIEYIAANLYAEMEDVFDAAKAKFRVQTPPTGNTLVALDSITLTDLLLIDKILRNNADAVKANIYSRVNTSLKALNEIFLTGRLNRRDIEDTDSITALRKIGRRKLRKSDN